MTLGNHVWRRIEPGALRAGDRTTDGYVVVRIEREIIDADYGTCEWFAWIETVDGRKPCPECGHGSFRDATQCCVCEWSFRLGAPLRATRFEHLEEEVL